MSDNEQNQIVIDSIRTTQTFLNSDELYELEMDRITDGKYSSYREEFARISAFASVNYPIHIEIENVYACNLKCGHCARNFAQIDDSGYMDFDLYKSIIDQATQIGTKSIGFATWGELMMDKTIFEKIAYAREKGIVDIRVHSNGIMIDEDKADKIVTSGVTWIGISLDAATEETYSVVRGGNFKKAQNAIGYLINAKLRNNTHVPKLRVSFVRQKKNEHEAELFRTKFHGIADVTIQDFRNNMGLTPEDQVQDYYPSDTRIDQAANQCIQPFERVFIRHDGRVVPCCSDIENRLAYGSLKDKTLFELFNSKAASNLKSAHLKKCPPGICKHCLTH